MKNILIILLFIIFSHLTLAQEVINIYTNNIPNAKNSNKLEEYHNGMYRNVANPTLQVFMPDKANNKGIGIIICPGGAYGVVVYDAEGIRTAKELTKYGITAFVLKYRIPSDETMIDKKIGPLQDLQQAIKVVRENSHKWGLDNKKIGVMGFSAGGHLAASGATQFSKSYIDNKEKTNLRPDFLILVYPVISMQDSLTHSDSRKNLLGENPSKEIIDHFSNEMCVTPHTPPTYIIHAADDRVVTVKNSTIFYEALKKNNVKAEIQIYPTGNHGFVLFKPTEEWLKPIVEWIYKILD